MESSVTILCPKCNRMPWETVVTGEAFNTHICYADCGNVYWTLNICPKCTSPQKTVFVKKPNFSELIVCQNCKSAMYYFRCPKKQCLALFYKNYNAYIMGLPLNCETCKFQYKSIACPCGNEVKMPVETLLIEGHTKTHCPCCKKDIIYTICSCCFKPNYHLDPLEMGEKIRCQHCKDRRSYVACPKCFRSVKADNFHYCEQAKCNYCSAKFQYSKCPYGCGINYHFVETSIGPIRTCTGCNNVYIVVNCMKCETTIYLDGLQIGTARRQKCPNQCGSEIKYYYCPCGKFNNVDLKCIMPTCPPPKSIQSDTIKQKDEILQKKNENYDAYECKLCFTEKSVMINQNCRHLMMCQGCFKHYKRTKGNQDNLPCPFCKQIGVYYKYVLPIFA